MCSSLLLFACFSLTIFLFNVDLDLEFDFELKLSNDLLVFLEYMFYKVLLRHNLVLIIIIIIIIKILYLGEYSPLRTFVPPQDKICCPQPAGLN
jgi:hypothetical protein